jgi:23S rRNA pseudouridine1911/1915/1917 synthase
MKKIVVTDETVGMRLDVFLTSHGDTSLPRSFYQKLIKKNSVFVNSKHEKSSYRIQTGDVITYDESSLTFDPLHKTTIEFDIIYEDGDIIVINKPAGLSVHPSLHVQEETLVNYLLAYNASLKNVGEDPLRPGIVHRIDKLASGLVVIAKNNNAFTHLKKVWQKGEVKKKYFVMVWGNIKDEGEIDLPIQRSKRTGKMVAVRGAEKKAVTLYKPLTYYTNQTLLEVETKTGRTHQIRTHFKSIGHPVVGDPLYTYKKSKTSLKRLFLHAYYLKIPLIANELKEWEIELPEELKNYLQTLKKIKNH